LNHPATCAIGKIFLSRLPKEPLTTQTGFDGFQQSNREGRMQQGSGLEITGGLGQDESSSRVEDGIVHQQGTHPYRQQSDGNVEPPRALAVNRPIIDSSIASYLHCF